MAEHFTDRVYQSRALERLRAAMVRGLKRLILHAPTGSGKTVLAAMIILRALAKGQRVLFVAHRRELLIQCRSKLLLAGVPAQDISVIIGSEPILRKPDAPVQIATIQSFTNKTPPPASMIFIDECFPAGTLVDGRSIETLRPGDKVACFDHEARRVVLRKVVRVSRTAVHGLVRVIAAGQTCSCTPSHPIYTREGYKPAHKLDAHDEVLVHDIDPTENLHRVRGSLRPALMEYPHDSDLFGAMQKGPSRTPAAQDRDVLRRMQETDGPHRRPKDFIPEPTDGPSLLLKDLHVGGNEAREVPIASGTQQEARIAANEVQQSNEGPGGAPEDVESPARDSSSPQGTRRQRHVHASPATNAGRTAWLGDRDGDSDEERQGLWLARTLQAGHCPPRIAPRDRSGRREPPGPTASGGGSPQGRILVWARVDRVEVLEPGRDGTFGGMCSEGAVYNLEIEEHHNYFANGFLVHNCHLAGADSFKKLLTNYPGAHVVGLTATPCRTDGKALGEVFEEIVEVARPSELVAQNYILEPTVWTVGPEHLPDLANVPRHGGDFDPRALAATVRKRHLVGSIVEHWQRRAAGLRTIVFATSRDHSRDIVAAFVAAGVRAVHVDGSSKPALRKRALEQLAAGEIDVLSNCDLFVEGLDVPSIKCVVLARPTESVTRYLQAVGRALRPWEGITPIVLDHAANARRHGLPTDDRTYSLEGRRKGAAPEIENFATRTCPACFLVTRAHVRVCPGCGAVFRADPARTIQTITGQLVELTREALQARLEAWNVLWHRAYREGYKGGWVDHAYRTRFGEHVPPYFAPPARPLSTPAQRAKALVALSGRAHREGHDDAWVVERYALRFGEPPPRGEIHGGTG